MYIYVVGVKLINIKKYVQWWGGKTFQPMGLGLVRTGNLLLHISPRVQIEQMRYHSATKPLGTAIRSTITCYVDPMPLCDKSRARSIKKVRCAIYILLDRLEENIKESPGWMNANGLSLIRTGGGPFC